METSEKSTEIIDEEEAPKPKRSLSAGLPQHAPSSVHSAYDSRFDSLRFEQAGSGTYWGAFNYANVIVGAGIVGVPYAVYNMGLWLGLILLAVTGFFTVVASKWIINVGLKRRRHNYDDLCNDVLGPAGGYFHSITSFVSSFTGNIAYMMICGSSFEDVALALKFSGFFADRRFYILIFGGFIMLPLSSFRDMHHLRFTSTISIAVEVGIMLLVSIYSRAYSLRDNDVVPFHEDKSERLGYFVGSNVFSGLPTTLFAFVGQQASFEVFRSLKEATNSNWKKVASIAVLAAGFLSSMLCLTSWLNLGDSIEPNIMDTFGPSDVPTVLGKLFLGITMFLTFPMDLFVCRRNINQAIFVSFLGMPEYMTFWRHIGITLAVWVAALALAILFSDLSSVFGFGGAIGSSAVGYITPSLMYIKAFEPEIRNAFKKSKRHGFREAALPFLCLLFGLVAFFAGTVSTALSIGDD